MAFRKICPSTSYPAQLSPELAVSSSCPTQDEADAETSRAFSVKRRRAPHTVTKNACLNCKKARAKVGDHLRTLIDVLVPVSLQEL